MIYVCRGHLWNKGRERHVKTLAVLLHFGADVNKHNMFEQTPLFVACERNLDLIALWLLGHGADPNKYDKVRQD